MAKHEAVNHSIEFVGPTGVHTQCGFLLQSGCLFCFLFFYYFNALLLFFIYSLLTFFLGIHREQSESRLDEFMWRERQWHNVADIFKDIIRETIKKTHPFGGFSVGLQLHKLIQFA